MSISQPRSRLLQLKQVEGSIGMPGNVIITLYITNDQHLILSADSTANYLKIDLPLTVSATQIEMDTWYYFQISLNIQTSLCLGLNPYSWNCGYQSLGHHLLYNTNPQFEVTVSDSPGIAARVMSLAIDALYEENTYFTSYTQAITDKLWDVYASGFDPVFEFPGDPSYFRFSPQCLLPNQEAIMYATPSSYCLDGYAICHVISFWLLPRSPGPILAYDIFSLGLDSDYRLVATLENERCVDHNPLSQSAWTFVTFAVELHSKTTAWFYHDAVLVNTCNLQSTVDILYVFPALTDFSGYMYNLIGRKSFPASLSSEILSPGCPAELSNCLPTAFFTPDGQPCLDSCRYSCLRTTDCGICEDILCDYCTGTYCQSCIPNATGNIPCYCQDGFYFNSAARTCEPCQPLCARCVSSTECTECIQRASFVGGTCTCLSGSYPATIYCATCEPSCATCDSSSRCTSCVENAYMPRGNNGLCKCDIGYYFDTLSKQCNPCPIGCDHCIGDPDSSCTWVTLFPDTNDNGKNYNSDGLCHNSCRTCNSVNANNCLSCWDGADIVESSCVCRNASPDPSNCNGCHPSCDTCSGPSMTECITCKGGVVSSSTALCTCPEGYYLSTTLYLCVRCAEGCASCTSSSARSCTSCLESFKLASDPPSSCFTDSNCHLPCLTCETSVWFGTYCLSCPVLFLLHNDWCSCPLGFVQADDYSCSQCDTSYYSTGVYPDTFNCHPCHPSCLTCSGGTDHDCISCSPDRTVTNVGTCPVCHPECLTCQDEARTSCLQCYDGMSLETTAPSSCKCNTSFYKPVGSAKCMPCEMTCATCSGGRKDKCLSCRGMRTLAGDPPNFCSCPSSYYSVELSAICRPCDPSCLACLLEGYLGCSSCKVNSQLAGPAPNYCKCKPGFYLDITDCRTCHFTCLTCYGPSELSCATCIEHASITTTGPRVCACDDGLYRSIDNICLPCNSQCSKCSAGTSSDCTSCLQYAHLVSTAPSACECDFVLSTDPTTCNPCDLTCATCSGNSSSDCLSCPAHAHLLGIAPNSCACDTGFVQTTISSGCEQCYSTCASCSSPNNGNCLTCAEHAEMAYDNFGYCVCATNTFVDTASLCQICHPTCFSCYDAGSSSCLSCKDGAVIVSYPGACVCDTGFFTVTDSSACIACDTICVECSESATHCTVCRPNSHPATSTPNLCECDSTAFPDSDVLHCTLCDVTCLTCNASGSDACTSCKAHASLSSPPGPSSCACDAHYYPIENSSNCAPCHVTCQTCSSGENTACQTCKDNADFTTTSPPTCQCLTSFYLDPTSSDCLSCTSPCVTCQNSAGNCVRCFANAHVAANTCVCDSTFFPSTAADNCLPCHALCLTCSADDENSCLSCALPKVLAHATPSPCVCEVGYYPSLDATNCLKCASTCKTCSDSGTSNCLTCWSFADLIGAFSPSACQCIDDPTGDPANCRSCDETCDTCEVTNPSQCLTCRTHAHLSGPSPNTCTCEPAFYPSSTASNCLPCDVTCLTCVDGTSTACSTCKANAVLTGPAPSSCACVQGFYSLSDASQCIQCDVSCRECTAQRCSLCSANAEVSSTSAIMCVCVAGFYPDPTAASCKACNALCTKCAGDPSKCSECKSLAHLSGLSPSACMCDSNTFLATSGCTLCDETCATCTGSGKDACSSCRERSSLSAGACMCDDGSYRSGKDCVACHAQCLTCTSGNLFSCTSCGANSRIRDGAIGPCECLSGFLRNREDSPCVRCMRYLSPSDMRAFINSSYMQLIIAFSKSVVITNLGYCAFIFSASSMQKLGAQPICTWTLDAKNLTVQFGVGYTLREEKLLLLTDNFEAAEGDCSGSKQILETSVTFEAPKKPPTPRITGPLVYAPACEAGLNLSAAQTLGLVGQKASYRWELKLLPSLANIGLFSTYAPENMEITIANNLLSGKTLNATVFVLDSFAMEGAASMLVSLNDSKPLSVELDAISPLRVPNSNSVKVAGRGKLLCTDTQPMYEYKWEFVNSSKATPEFSSTSFQLSILPNKLAANAVYEFRLSVSGGGSTGEARITIETLPTPLVIAFTRSDGDQPVSSDLVLNATASYDPDDAMAVLKFTWTCMKGTSVCNDKTGNTLVLNDGSVLTVKANTLQVSSTYVFTLTLKSGAKDKTASLTINVIPASNISINISTNTIRVPPGEAKTIYTKIYTSESVMFEWKQVSGKTLVLATPLNWPWIKIAAGEIASGDAYKFTLKVSSKIDTVMQYLIIVANRSPAFGSLTSTPSTGEAILTTFNLQAIGWDDPDAGDYPLQYQFGIDQPNRPLFICDFQNLGNFLTFFSMGKLVVIVDVCDSLNGCTRGQTTVDVTDMKSRTAAAIAAAKTRFADAVKTINGRTPSTIIAFAKTLGVNADATMLNSLFAATKAYQSKIGFNDNGVLSTLLSCCASMVSLKNVMLLPTVESISNFLMSAFEFSTETVSDANARFALSMFSDLYGKADLSATISNYNADMLKYLDIAPAETPVVIPSELGGTVVTRATTTNSNNLNQITDSYEVWFPDTFFTDMNFPGNEICDSIITQYNNLTAPSPTLSVSLFATGTYSYTGVKFIDPIAISAKNLTNPIKITLSINSLLPGSSYVAVASPDNNSSWSTQGINLVSITNKSAFFESNHLTKFKIDERKLITFESAQWPILTSKGIVSCANSYSPVILADGQALLLLIFLFVVRLRKIRRAATPSEEPHEIVKSHRKESVTETDPFAISPPIGEVFVPTPPSQKHSKPSYLRFHSLLGFLFDRHFLLRLLLAVSQLHSEQLTLGVANKVRFGDWSAAAAAGINSWSRFDFISCLVALTVGQVYSCLMLKAYWQVTRRHKLFIWGFAVCVACVTLVMNGAIIWLATTGCDDVLNRWTAEMVAVVIVELSVVSWLNALVWKLASRVSSSQDLETMQTSPRTLP